MKKVSVKKLLGTARRGVIAALVFSLLCSTIAYGAGSRNLTSDLQSDGTWAGNGGYRPYSEWYKASTAHVNRLQKLHVYVKQGEILYFGSNVTSSTVAGGEISVTRPDGSVDPAWDLDVVSGGKGYIGTRQQELAGPSYRIDGISYNAGGYTPLSITVDMEGVWNFEFRSSEYKNGNPASTLVDAAWNKSTGTVAAWDITVISTANGAPVEKTGRLFANLLSLNMGSNISKNNVLNSTVYVLTKDGYVYSTDFNGMDPFGFIFFANNRGLVDLRYNQSLYHSVRDPDPNITNANNVAALSQIDVGFQLPTSPDTALDSTYKIFFEEPSDDLPASIKPTAYAPEAVTDFYFYGDDHNHGYVGAGGYFYFTVTRASSFQVEIDMTNYEYTDEATGATVNGGVVYLANSCVEGKNRVYWDGKDARGVTVPAGVYGTGNNDKITVRIKVKSGEYHFPIIDAEQNLNGIKIQLITTPLNADNSEIPLTDYERSLVYYNNATVTQTNISGVSPNGFAANQLAGMDSRLGASAFTGNLSGLSDSGGDKCAIDIWTYFGGDLTETSTELGEFVLVGDDGAHGALSGFVFYDTNNNGLYKLEDIDYALSGIEVELRDSFSNVVATTTTDFAGFYSFPNLEYGSYTVNVKKPFEQANCSTGNNQVQTVEVNSLLNKADDVGFHYDTYNKTISVDKSWVVDKAIDIDQPSSVIVEVQGKNGNTVEVKETAVLSNSNGWHYVFRDLPRLSADGHTALTYGLVETGQDALGNPVEGYTAFVDPPLDTGPQLQYTIKNVPNVGTIVVSKVDDAGNPVPNAEFELFRRSDGGNVSLGTFVSDANGNITVTDLPYDNTYYFFEAHAPEGYSVRGSGQTQDITPTLNVEGCVAEITVVNDRVTGSLEISKTLTAAAAEDEDFVFRITGGPENVDYFVSLTVPAGQLTARRAYSGIVAGTYTVTELASNRSYSLNTGLSKAYINSVEADDCSDGSLTLTVADAASGPYLFSFSNTPVEKEQWLSDSAKVINQMQ